MNNNINTLINSLAKIGEIRKADKNNGEYSSTSDNTMAVGTKMHNKKFFFSQEIRDALVKQFQDIYLSKNGHNIKDDLILGPQKLSNLCGCSKLIVHPDTFEVLDEDVNAADIIKECGCIYFVVLSIPIEKYDLVPEETKIKQHSSFYVDLFSAFSPFEFSFKEHPINDVKTSKECGIKNTLWQKHNIKTQNNQSNYSSGKLSTLIKNGRLVIFKIDDLQTNSWILSNGKLNIRQLWSNHVNTVYVSVFEKFSTDMQCKKSLNDLILTENIYPLQNIFFENDYIDFNFDFPFSFYFCSNFWQNKDEIESWHCWTDLKGVFEATTKYINRLNYNIKRTGVNNDKSYLCSVSRCKNEIKAWLNQIGYQE